MPQIIYGTIPSLEVVNEFEADVITLASWVDIYESDNVTPWKERVAITEGSVSVDMTRSERRNLDVTILDLDDEIGYGPGAFWYDKVIKPYRGIVLANGDTWVTCLGEFMPDSISRPHFPDLMRVTSRDFTKKLMNDKFTEATAFAAGQNIGTVVQSIATNGGIDKFNFESTTYVTGNDVAFARGDERWKACAELAASIGFEIFFNSYGYMVFRPTVDPLTAPVTYTFRTGTDGNLVSFNKSTTDNFLFNDVIVHGSSTTNPLVYGRATNTDPSSPTAVDKVGRKIKLMENSFVVDNTAADAMAASYLAVSGLEQFDVSLESMVIPWLEAGDAVELILPDSAPIDPTRFLMSNFTIPLGLTGMSGSAKRVTIVG
jgi:hypothetical protein